MTKQDIASRLAIYADRADHHPAYNGTVPLTAATLREAAGEIERVRAALAELVGDVFGPEREPGEPIPEGNAMWDLTTEAWLAREARYRAVLTKGDATPPRETQEPAPEAALFETRPVGTGSVTLHRAFRK